MAVEAHLELCELQSHPLHRSVELIRIDVARSILIEQLERLSEYKGPSSSALVYFGPHHLINSQTIIWRAE